MKISILSPYIVSVALILAAFLAGTAATGGSLQFSPEGIVDWQEEEFSGRTEYRLVEVNGRPAVHARCDRSASALFLEQRIDLRRTPVIEWSWRIKTTFDEAIDETTRTGDDYPARLYVVKDGGWRFWRTRAVNYVWASGQAEGASWPNAYVRQAMMLAVRSGPAGAGEWVTQRRNIVTDFEKLHGGTPDVIDGVAIMTDCDDRETEAQAWYGTIRFLPE